MSESPAPAAPAEPPTTSTPDRLDPSQYALRLFARCGKRPPDRGLWRTLVDYAVGTVREFTVQSPPRKAKSGQIITCKPRTVPARYVVLAAYHVYFLSDGGGAAGTDRDRWSIPKMARGCRLSVRYMADALTVCHALRIVKRVRDSQRKGYRYLMNAGGMTFAALRTRVQQTASRPSTVDGLSTSTVDGPLGYVRMSHVQDLPFPAAVRNPSRPREANVERQQQQQQQRDLDQLLKQEHRLDGLIAAIAIRSRELGRAFDERAERRRLTEGAIDVEDLQQQADTLAAELRQQETERTERARARDNRPARCPDCNRVCCNCNEREPEPS